MKVRCVDCKKRFDYDLYSGVCPKCGNYMRPPEMETSENRNCEVEGSHIHTESAESGYTATYAQEDSYTETYKAPEIRSDYTENPKKKKKSNKVITVFLTVLMITTFLVTIIVVYVGQKTAHESMVVNEPVPVTICQAGDSFSYVGDNNKYDIYIDTVTTDEDPNFELPRDYEVIVVNYHVERTYLNNGGSDYDAYYEIKMIPYLETTDGYYLEPVSEYELRKVKDIQDYEEADEMGLGTSFSHKEGKLYYYVKKDDVSNLYITSKDYDSENYEVGALREIIRVEGLEVTR